MISLLLAGLTQVLVPPPSAPRDPAATSRAQPERDEARYNVQRAAQARRAAIDAAIESRVISRGYFQLVTDIAEQRAARTRAQQRLRSIGIPASVGACRWMGMVSEGTPRGNRSYGGACSVRMGSLPPRNYLICEADLGGITLADPAWFADDAEYIEMFIRRTCL